jgi:hypothetical protein
MKHVHKLIFLAVIPLLAQQNNREPRPSATTPDGWRKFSVASAQDALPAQLTLPAGSWVRIRVNQMLSSNRNQAGDPFTASLLEPIVVDGIVIARRGQTLAGRVVEAQKAGRVKGTSKLAVELTEISFADGQQMALKSQLVEYSGGTSKGRDAAAIGSTTGVGAAIGAAAAGPIGAGIGAGAGLVASTIGVMSTRGKPTILYPESILSFRTTEPLTISTVQAPHAFLSVTQDDFDKGLRTRQGPPPTMMRRPAYFYSPYGYGPRFYGGYYGRRW